MFESRISAGATDKLLGLEKPHAKTVAVSYDMVGHEKKCVERYWQLAKKQNSAVVQSLNSLLGRPSLQEGRFGDSRRTVTSILSDYLKYVLYFGTIWYT